MRRRRKQLIVVSALLVLFVVLLAVWVGNPNSGHNKPEVQAHFTPTPTPTTPTETAALPTPTPSGHPSTGGGGIPSLPPVSGVQLYGPGVHVVTITVSSNSTLAGVGWAFRNGKNGKKSPGTTGKFFTLTTNVEGGAPLAIVGGQVAYYGTQATCTITVDGTLRTTQTVHGAYHVVVCTG